MSYPLSRDDFAPDPEVTLDPVTGAVLKVVLPMLPSDFHNHFRVGELMQAITPEVSWPYRYVLAMPNTSPHIYTVADARRYKSEVMSILTANDINHTELVMTIYLSPETTPETITELATCGMPIAVKSYPPGATTNSGEAAPLLEKLDVLAAMEREGIRLLIHGECTHDADGADIPHEDREEYFYKHAFPVVREKFPNLKICCEHITTAVAVEAVKADQSGNTVCTITPQHGMLDLSAFEEEWGGNHARCMPYLKSRPDVIAIRTFMTSGDARVILGTDCAPHLSKAKNGPFEKAACGCYTPHAMAMYTQIFAECCALDWRFVRFACTNGPDWWDLPRPDGSQTLTLVATENGVPKPTVVPGEDDIVVPLGWTDDPEVRMPLPLAACQNK